MFLSDPFAPTITLLNGKILHNGKACEVSMRRDRIQVACSSITVEAAKFIMEKWHQEFDTPEKSVVIQTGSTEGN